MTTPPAFVSPFLRSDEAAIYLGYRGKHALRSLYRFIQKNGVRTSRRFRTLLIAKADLDRAIGATRQKTAPDIREHEHQMGAAS